MNRRAGKPATAQPKPAPPDARQERLQKILARAGVASRRAAEELIAAGRVMVNGQVVTEMGTRADPSTDKIEVGGHPIAAPSPSKADEFVYIMLNKPLGVVSTAKDPQGRPTVLDLIKTKDEGRRTKDYGPTAVDDPTPITQHPTPTNKRLYPVGRLDTDSTGLILLTNDGELTFRLTHPKFGVDKEYRALVRGKPGTDELKRLREGVEIEGEMTAPARVEETGRRGENSRLSITIHEGRKRQVRLMCAAVGHPVIELERVRFGPLALGSLQPGKWRHLAMHEVHALQRAVRLRR